MEGFSANKQEFKQRGKFLSKQFDSYKDKKKENEFRIEGIPKSLDLLKIMKDNLPEILVKKPWITEEESKDVFAKIDETWKWIETKAIEQNLANLYDEPVFKMDELLK